MSAKYSQAFGVGILILNLLSSAALADSATTPAAPVTPLDPKAILAEADKALEIDRLDEAMKLYLQAAELNYTPAQVKLGELADYSQFYEAAVGWYIMAAMQGDAAAQYHLARMYLNGFGIEQDDAKASYWYRRSAAKDYVPSVKVLADSYRLGLMGVKVDLDQARAWDAKAKRLEAIEQAAIVKKLEALAEARKKLQEEAAKKTTD